MATVPRAAIIRGRMRIDKVNQEIPEYEQVGVGDAWDKRHTSGRDLNQLLKIPFQTTEGQ